MRFAPLPLLMLLALGAVPHTPQQPSVTSIRSWKCDFPSVAVNDWKAEQPAPALEEQAFAFHIDNVNAPAGSARLIGNVGSTDLVVLAGAHAVHFLERTPMGDLNITTIFADVARNGSFKAVHSRHLLMLATPLPSQAYGFCQPWQ